MQLAANTTWFNFTTAGASGFGVYSFSGKEETSATYEFTIELVHLSSSVDITGMEGQEACLTIADRSGGSRFVHGLIRRMEQLHTSNMRTHYRCHLVPRLYFLGLGNDHRIFQNKSVIDIISEILQEQGFAGDAFFFNCGSYEPREYCVQYGESDLHFISRLCEEEGIYFYFNHSQDKHCLCFCDRESGPPICGGSQLRFFPGSGQAADTAVISRLNLHTAVQSNASAYREWNFEKPKLNLEVLKKEGDSKKAPVPAGMDLEVYQYPHLYQLQAEGKRYVNIQLLRQLTFTTWVEGETDVARLAPGFTFEAMQHPRTEVNDLWTLTSVTHVGEQPQVLEHEAPDRGMYYHASFAAIPERTRFVPALRHPKTLVTGDQTAIVTGPEGEEIYPDKYGRVKVQFFWDRLDQWNENTTCWIRPSQGWAGNKYGTIAIPRVGHEVIVSFLEGNPDRPIITGRVYHDLNMPPYQLPDHKTRTVFKSMSTPGEENEQRGFNEFRIEDKKGQEEIYIHAEKDVNIHVKNDWKEHILHDRHQTVDNFSYTRVKGEDHWIIEQPRKVELLADDHLTVKADSHSEYCTKWLVKTGQEIHFKAGEKVVIEAGSDLTIKGGGAFIRLTPAGVIIKGGNVNINEGGSAGSGSGAAVQTPEEAIGVDAAGRPIQPEIRKGEEKEEEDGIATAAGGGNPEKTTPAGLLPPDNMWGKKIAFCMKEPNNQRIKAINEAAQNGQSLSQKKGVIGDTWRKHADAVKRPSALKDKVAEANRIANQYGYQPEKQGEDVWRTPESFLANRGGDCEDYALYKYALLAQAGVPKEDMSIAILTTQDGTGHAVLLVKEHDGSGSYVLDNFNKSSEAYDPSYDLKGTVDHEKRCIPGTPPPAP